MHLLNANSSLSCFTLSRYNVHISHVHPEVIKCKIAMKGKVMVDCKHVVFGRKLKKAKQYFLNHEF